MSEIKTVVVLGMHRSGTSLVAKSLAHETIMGPPEFESAALTARRTFTSNDRYEDPAFVQINKNILGRAGGSWRKPPPKHAINAAGVHYEKDIKALIELRNAEAKKAGLSFWGWKDPRTTLTIRCYTRFLRNPHFVCVFRDPDDIAANLMKREHMGRENALKLIGEYNARLIEFLLSWTYQRGDQDAIPKIG